MSSRLQAEVKIRLLALGVKGLTEDYRFVAESLGTGKGLRERLAKAGLNDFQLDLAIPDLKIGVEVNGGQYAGRRSGHGSISGLERDAKKTNQAIMLGWRVFVITSTMANCAEELQKIADFIKKIQDTITRMKRLTGSNLWDIM